MKKLIIPFFLAVTFIAISLQPSHASPPSTLYSWAKWEVVAEFSSGAPNVEMTILVGDLIGWPPIPNVLATSTIPLSCNTHGAVIYSGGKASFTGGHIACDMPSFVDAVHDLTNGEFTPCGQCIGHTDAFGNARITPTETSENPIFWHPSLTFSAPYEMGNNYLQLNLSLPGTLSSTSLPFPVISGWNDAASVITLTPPNYNGIHSLNGAPQMTSGPLTLPHIQEMDPVTIYLGHDGGGYFFKGDVFEIKVDPGCLIGG